MYQRFKDSLRIDQETKSFCFKYTPNTLKHIAVLVIFTAASVLPSEALAFSATIAASPLNQFRIPLESPFTAFAPVTNDPELLNAINSVPNYRFTEAGSAVGHSTPLTELGNWPKPVAQRPVQRITPVTLAAPAVAVAAKPAPAGSAVLVLQGEASFYSRAGCLGCNPGRIMANGQPLNDNALTMAIGADKKHLVGRKARVTSLATGQSTLVTITDTGGFYKAKYGNRVADLTIGTKQAIGMAGGVGKVRVEVF